MNKYLRSNIIHEDEELIFVNKTAGILSIPDRYDQNIPNLKSILSDYCQNIFVMHRLDKDTSGITVFAKTEEAHKSISEQWQNNGVEKTYLAITSNIPSSETGTIEAPIQEHQSKKGTYVVSNLGKPSTTHFEVVSTFGEYALLKLKIDTGRTHQIRVHLSYIGCPLLVDPVYGYQSQFFLSSIKKKKMNLKKGMEERPLLSRTPLHASSLQFKLPLNNQTYSVKSELPKDIRAIQYQLEKRFK